MLRTSSSATGRDSTSNAPANRTVRLCGAKCANAAQQQTPDTAVQYRLTLATLDSTSDTFSAFEAGTCTGDPAQCMRWLGAPAEFSDSPSPSFAAAATSCDPPTGGSATFGSAFYAYGAEILPSSTYDVHMTVDGTNFTYAGTVTTGKFGDVAAPFGGEGEPSFLDISAMVAKFIGATGAPSKVFSKLARNVPLFETVVSFADISRALDGFRDTAYSSPGPCPCPSEVACGPGNCAEDDCLPGEYCNILTGKCEDVCGRCNANP